METQLSQAFGSRTNGSHVATPNRVRSRQDEIVEVRPPAATKEKHLANRATLDAESLPLVSTAHEFKTPLVVILGYTDLLRNGKLGPVNEKQEQVLNEIHEGAQRLHKVIHDLLLLCELRSSSEKPDTRNRAHASLVNEDVKEVFSYWSSVAGQRAIEYEFFPAAGVPRVQIDSLKLQQAISNLIENALKFTPRGGRIEVAVSACFWERRKAQSEFLFNMERKRQERVENAVRIDVRDTGPGIPREHHEDIFGDFVQLPRDSTRGTGLGLAITRRLVEGSGGVVWVESTPNQGSTFSVLLSQVSGKDVNSERATYSAGG